MKSIFENIIEKLENELKLADEEKLRCARENPLQFDSAKGYSNGVANSIAIVKQEAEQYNNGWIPCSERLPETNESVLCWAKSTARGGDVCFVGSCHNSFWFLQSSADTHSFPGQYVIVAWQPLPEPYHPKGE